MRRARLSAAARGDDIEADRPGFGESASVVDRGRVQLGFGLSPAAPDFFVAVGFSRRF